MLIAKLPKQCNCHGKIMNSKKGKRSQQCGQKWQTEPDTLPGRVAIGCIADTALQWCQALTKILLLATRDNFQ